MIEGRNHAARSTEAKAEKSLSPVGVIVAAVCLVAFVALVAYRSFGPFTAPKTFSVQDQREWVKKLARDNEGDFSRLSPADQKRLNDISMGNGARYLRALYEKKQ